MEELDEMFDSDYSFYFYADLRDETGAVKPAVGCMVPVGCLLPVLLIMLTVAGVLVIF